MRYGPRILAITVIAGLVVAGAGSASPTSDDVSIRVTFYDPLGTTKDPTKTERTNFQIEVAAESTSGAMQAITVRIALGAGIRWGNNPPDPTEDCTTASPNVCTTKMTANEAGTTGGRWAWDVVVDGPGNYEITATVEPEQPDPDASNNTFTFRFQVVSPGGGSGGGGGGGSAVTKAGVVKLSPLKPKAGSTIVASVRVTRGGSPVRPTSVTCSATVGGTKVKGSARGASGVASCQIRTPRSAKGKTLAGSVSFRAGGSAFTKRFATRLG